MLPAGLWLSDFFFHFSYHFCDVAHTYTRRKRSPFGTLLIRPSGQIYEVASALEATTNEQEKKRRKNLQTHTPDIHVQTLGKCVCVFIGE